MNWEALSAIGELLGATAVVVTLGYLAIQVKFAKQASTDSVTLERAKAIRDGMMAIATDDNLRDSFLKVTATVDWHEAMASELNLNIDESGRSHFLLVFWFWLHWAQFTAAKSESDLDELKELIRSFYPIPGVRYCWDHSPWTKPSLDQPFIEFVELALLKEEESSN